MKKRITVLVPFTEGRTQHQYKPGDEITDPQWHADGDRRAEAYAARGKVKIEVVPEPKKKEGA